MIDIVSKISELVGQNKRIGVAVSGGVDSMVMLELFLDYQKGHGGELFVVNVDHMIRGKESERDSIFVADYCKNKGITLFYKKIDVPSIAKDKKMTLEEAGRFARYSFFDELLEDKKIDLIATAHHMNDQTETLLMRLARGSGVKGLVGIKETTGRYIRPLLSVSKALLTAISRARDIPHILDSSNLDTRYTRNYFRGVIIPFLTERDSELETFINHEQATDCQNSTAMGADSEQETFAYNQQSINCQSSTAMGADSEQETFINHENVTSCQSSTSTVITGGVSCHTSLTLEKLNSIIMSITESAKTINNVAEKHTKNVFFRANVAYVKIDAFSNLLFAKYAIDKAFSYFGVHKDIETRHIAELQSLATRENGKSMNMPFNLLAYKEYDFITLSEKKFPVKTYHGENLAMLQILKTSDPYGYYCQNVTILEDKNDIICAVKTIKMQSKNVVKTNGERSNAVEYSLTQDANCQPNEKVKTKVAEHTEQSITDINYDETIKMQSLIIDLDKLPKKVSIRARREGDLFQNVCGENKLLSDFLQERKIPQRIRDSIRLLCDGSEVLFIEGIAISDKLKTDENTTIAMLFEYNQNKVN